MKCQSCRKRKAAHTVIDDLLGSMNVCTRCKVSLYDELDDFAAIEQAAERANEARSMDTWYSGSLDRT